MSSLRLTTVIGDSELLATAWPIAPRVVVTALHGVAGEGATAWHPGAEPALHHPDTKEPIPLRLLLCDGEADLALLELPQSAPRLDPLQLAPARAARGREWTSRGLPADVKGGVTLKGSVVDYGEAADRGLQLHVIQGTARSWRGVSGAPLLNEDRVIGVITTELPDGDTAWAADVERLRELSRAARVLLLAESRLRDHSAQKGLSGQRDPLAAFQAQGRCGAAELRAALATQAKALPRLGELLEKLGHELRVAVVSGPDLREHQAAVCSRVGGLPGVREAVAVRAEVTADLPAMDEVDRVVVLLGWDTLGGDGLDVALKGPDRVVLASDHQPKMSPSTDFAALGLAGARRGRFPGAAEFTDPAQAAELSAKALDPWLSTLGPNKRATLPSWAEAYLNKRQAAWAVFELGSLSQGLQLRRPSRPEIYVNLRVQPDWLVEDEEGRVLLRGDGRRGSPEELEMLSGELPGRRRELRAPFVERAVCHPSARRALIEGEAGSGKTLLLRHLAQALAERLLAQKRSAPDQLDAESLRDGAPLLPVPVLIRADHLLECLRARERETKCAPGLRALARALIEELREADVSPPSIEEMVRALQSGEVLAMVDSLDEVAAGQDRQALVAFLRARCQAAPKLRLLLTTRPTPDTGPLRDIGPMRKLSLAPLDDDGQRELVHKWAHTWGRPPTWAAGLLHAMADLEQRRVSFPVGNPLLLTAIVVVFEVGKQRLPDNAALLYHRVVEALCHSRGDDAHLPNERRELLALLYEGAQRAGEVAWSVERAAAWLYKQRPERLGTADQVEHLLSTLANDTGLIQFVGGEGAGAQLKAPHRSFQEFLAAWSLAVLGVEDLSVGERVDRLLRAEEGSPASDPFWRGTLGFLVGVFGIGSTPNARHCIERLDRWARGEAESALQDPAALRLWVAEALAEYRHHFEEHPLLERLPGELLADFRAHAAAWPTERRVEQLEALGRLGDPRLEQDPWVRVEGGRFTMGGDRKAWSSVPAQARTPPDLDVSWRLVTVADFEPFVDVGYAQGAPWRDAPEELRARLPWDKPEGWLSQRHWPNRPVVGVCLWEALAWCRWVNAEVAQRARWHLAEGEALDLPLEVEWEYAARGTDGRVWPWGEADLQEGPRAQANWWPAWSDQRARVSPVGAFPHGDRPWGRRAIADLSGDTWEWCLDPWDEDTHRAVDAPAWRQALAQRLREGQEQDVNTFVTSSRPRVVRGGSWASRDPEVLRCAFRGRDEPEDRSTDLGFRVVRRRLR